MANYTTTANVVLSVNGKQAQKMLATLEKDAKRLERELAKASTAGDKATMKKLQRELKSTQRMMEQLKGSSSSAAEECRNLGIRLSCFQIRIILIRKLLSRRLWKMG